MPLSEETRLRIENALLHWNDPDSEARLRFEAIKSEIDLELKPLRDAIVASETITEKDLSLRMTI